MPARPNWPPGGYRPALRGTCPDADDASVEAAEATVSNLKASEFKPGRRHAHHGRILAPGGRRMEPARVAVAGETRRCLGVRDPRCRPDSRGSRTRANYRTVAMGIAFRTSMIVPAPNGARCLEVPADAPLWQEFRSAVSTERLNRPSANRKRSRSISRVFQSIRGAIRGSVGAAESSTRHRHACGPVGGQPARAPLVREPPWLGHVLDAADLSAPRRMRVAV